MNFNAEQLVAIQHDLGPAIVTAPAGSGKTSCFVQRIARLRPTHKVLGITYTKAAANHMKERIQRVVPEELHAELNISTIHSLCWSILRDADVELSMAMQAKAFLLPPFAPKTILETFITDKTVKLSTLTSAFSLAKNFNVRPAESLDFFIEQGLANPEFLQEAYGMYEAGRHDYRDKSSDEFIGRYDQDDVLVLTVDYLETNEDLRWRWGSRYKYILVDEAQDTSPVQFRIIELLMEGGSHNNVMFVGDLRQSIYGFRGAYPHYLQEFADKHEAKVINLLDNYRSTSDIVQLANTIASKMTDIDERFRPDMKTGRTNA